MNLLIKEHDEKGNPLEEFLKKDECNMNWDYFQNGNDWKCKCSVGNLQSPINLCALKTQKTCDDVYFQFLDNVDFDLDQPQQKISNTGKTVKIDYKLGKLIMENKFVEYEGYQIHFHVPSEHTLENEFMDMEMHLVYHLSPRNRMVDVREYNPFIIVSVLFKAYDDFEDESEENIIKSSFLDQFLNRNKLDS